MEYPNRKAKNIDAESMCAMPSETPNTVGWATKLWLIFPLVACLAACGPSISDLKPSVGASGDKVLISGSKLTVGGNNPKTVDFNGVKTSVKAVGSNVETQVPKGASTGPVQVSTSYVDFYSPGGTAKSPFDFTVVSSSFTEKEPNDTRKTANNASLAQVINGSITDSSPVDWFKITSGPSGPWGYGIEIFTEAKNLPKGVSLRVDVEGYRADLNAVGYLNTYSGNKAFTLWTTHAPVTDIFLKVGWVGSTSKTIKADYSLKIARIKINDTNEDDNTFKTAEEIKMSNGVGSHKTSYLCNIFRGGTDVGMQDFFFFNPGGATNISVVVVSPPLNQKDGVYVDLYDNAQGYRGGDKGKYVAADYNLKLTGGEKAQGQWYIEVTNAWDHYATAGAGPKDAMPLSCKAPYSIMVTAK